MPQPTQMRWPEHLADNPVTVVKKNNQGRGEPNVQKRCWRYIFSCTICSPIPTSLQLLLLFKVLNLPFQPFQQKGAGAEQVSFHGAKGQVQFGRDGRMWLVLEKRHLDHLGLFRRQRAQGGARPGIDARRPLQEAQGVRAPLSAALRRGAGRCRPSAARSRPTRARVPRAHARGRATPTCGRSGRGRRTASTRPASPAASAAGTASVRRR